MFNRLIKLPESQSFFLFGARGVGKSTLLERFFTRRSDVLWFDLLDPVVEERFTVSPGEFKSEVLSRLPKIEWIVIDEVQKCPKILNYVHHFIETKRLKFALTGSSARRLKQQGVNLLAGRAFMRELFPLTHKELVDQFHINDILKWGSLPQLYRLKDENEKIDFLRSYALSYIKNEIQSEQWVRKLEPFRRFLPVASQMNGEIINYSNISKDIGADVTTVQSYYEILEDTLLGFYIPAFAHSIRKQQKKAPKFYFFDTGIVQALKKTLDFPLMPQSFEYGKAFEHFIILELFRLCQYAKKDISFSYLRTKDDAEIDLIIEGLKKYPVLIEIKSKAKIDEKDAHSLIHFMNDFPKSEFYLLSQDTIPKMYRNKIHAIPWYQAFDMLGLESV
ncbi:MAG: ATP-binding protein [Deltaproteobacteria bacterium]|nr:ATP-binding protein [Deltaproteobacteria bacterium]